MNSVNSFGLGQKVFNEKFGTGIVISKVRSRRGTWNYGVKFENGGPQGWADKATNDVKDLQVVN